PPPASPLFPYPTLFRSAERRLGAGPLALRLHFLRPRRFRFVAHAPALVDEDLLRKVAREAVRVVEREQEAAVDRPAAPGALHLRDRKSTRLNSSHEWIS